MKIVNHIRVSTSAFLVWILLIAIPSSIASNLNRIKNSFTQSQYTATIETAQVTTGGTIVVNWSAPEGHSSIDQIRLSRTTDSDNSYHWSQQLGTATSGSFTVTVPNQTGRFEFRLFRGTDLQKMGQSNSFTINLNGFTVSASPENVNGGGQITVNWDAPAGQPTTDVIRLARINNSASEFVSQQYTNGVYPGSAQITAPSQAGQYEVHYLTNSGLAALSSIFTVEASIGLVEGAVKSKETRSPISNALVEILQSGAVKANYRTDSTGSYQIPVAQVGTYDLRVTANGFPESVRNNIAVNQGDNIIVDFELSNTGAIAGIILKNGSAQPITGATVKIKQNTNVVSTVLTDGSGRYQSNNLPPGTYSAEVSANGYSSAVLNNLVVNAGGAVNGNFNLSSENQNSAVEYVYDAAGRIVAVKEQGVLKSIYKYDSSGNLLSIANVTQNLPAIIDFTPKSGPIGTQVIIQGINFGSPSQINVKFNGVSAIVTSATDTEIVTSVPAGASTGLISITNANGTETSSLPFTVDANASLTPIITGFSPAIGKSGDTVTITGNNFANELYNNTVLFGTEPATVLSATSTTLTVKANTSSGKVSVITPEGKATSQSEFYSLQSTINASQVGAASRTWFGLNRTVQLNQPNKSAFLVFDGEAGKRFSVKLSNLTCHIGIKIYRPDGKLQSSTSFSAYNWIDPDSWFIDTQIFPLTGTYTIVATPDNGAAPCGFNSLIHDVPPDVSDTIMPDSVKTVWIGTPGQNGVLTYSAEAGQKILINIKDNTYDGTAKLLRAVNTTSNSSSSSSSSSSQSVTVFGFARQSNANYSPDGTTIPATGTYTIFLDPVGPKVGPMTVKLWNVPPDLVKPINIGDSFGVTIENSGQTIWGGLKPGQNAWFTFNGVAGQRISLLRKDAPVVILGNTISSLGAVKVSFNKPDGTFIRPPEDVVNGHFIDVLTLPVTGSYKILVDPFGADTGSAMFELYDVPSDIVGSTTIGGAPVTVNAAIPGHNPTITFDALQGEQARVNITGSSLSNSTPILLKDPGGNNLAACTTQAGSCIISSTTLPVSGTYKIVVDPIGANTGNATISVGGDVFGNITAGGSGSTTTVNNPGQSGWLAFTGTAGQRVSVAASNVTFSSGNLSIRNANGAILGTSSVNSSGGFLDTVILPADGEYRLVVDPDSDYTGSATLTLYNVPADAAGAINIGGDAETRSTTIPGQNLALTFNGTAEQKISLTVSSVTIPSGAGIYIRKSDGTVITSSGAGASGNVINNILLPQTGTYTLYVDPSGANTGSITMQLGGFASGSTSTSQLAQSVSVQRGFNNAGELQISSALSVLFGNVQEHSPSSSVSVRFGNAQEHSPSSSVSVTTGPNINGVSPNQIARGTTVTLNILGDNLSQASEIRFYTTDGTLDTGLVASNISVNSTGTVITATLTISPNAVIGNRIIVVTTPVGLSQRDNTVNNVIQIIQ